MTELEIIKYLINEIEQEQKYNAEYEDAHEFAKKQAKKEEGKCSYGFSYYKYMPEKYLKKSPKKSVIIDNCKKARQLLLKISKEV